jgi:hypothetical protein
LREVSKVASRTFLSVAHCPRYLHIINICATTKADANHRKKQQLIQFGNNLITSLKDYGIVLNSPCKIRDVSSVTDESNLELRRTQFCAKLDVAWNAVCPNSDIPATGSKLVLVALGGTDAGVYADVRWWADCKVGIPCICVSPNGVAKGAGAGQNMKIDRAMLGNLA